MSTYWGFHCKTCPQDREPCNEDDQSTPYSDHRMNHGQGALRNIANFARHFKAIGLGDSTGYIEMRVMAYGSGPIYWVIEHEGHDIELHNEYGKVEPIMTPAPGSGHGG